MTRQRAPQHGDRVRWVGGVEHAVGTEGTAVTKRVRTPPGIVAVRWTGAKQLEYVDRRDVALSGERYHQGRLL